MTERERFEAWASNNNEWPQCIERSGDSYKLMQTKLKWEAWQAARAQPAQAVPLLSDKEMEAVIRPFYRDSYAASMAMLNGIDEYRAVEQAVRAKMGVD